MTWNIAHAETGVASVAGYIKDRAVDVVILQEVNNTTQPAELEAELESQTGATWYMTYHSNCEKDTATGLGTSTPSCGTEDNDGVAILSKLAFQDTAAWKYLWGRDSWTDARAALRVSVLFNSTLIYVFGTHLAAFNAGDTGEAIATRADQVSALKAWMDGIQGPRIVGGDFNAQPTETAIVNMTSTNPAYMDAWAQVGSGAGVTHTVANPTRRIDYLFSIGNGTTLQPIAASRPGYSGTALSDHYAVVVDYGFGSATNTPYGGTAASIPGTIQAEAFDNGGQNVGYSDGSASNAGGQYRSTDVDIETTSDSSGAYNVGWFGAGEWLKYTIQAGSSGNFTLNTRLASTGTGGSFYVEVDGVNVTGAVAVPNTGGWQTWSTVSTPGIFVSAGLHVLRLVGNADGSTGVVGNLNWLQLQSGTVTTLAVPGRIEAEDFRTGGDGTGYHDDESTNRGGQYRTSEGVDIEATGDVSGGYNLGWFGAGEWLAYNVAVQTGGTYTITSRLANTGSGGSLHFELDGADVSGAVAVPATGGWQTWQSVAVAGITLSSGNHVLRIVGDTESSSSGAVGNLNYVDFAVSQTTLLTDSFDGTAINTSKWSVSVLSGTQDTSLTVAEGSGTLNIGPLFQSTSGLHYNGILANNSLNMNGAFAQVQVVNAAATNTAGTTSFTLVVDASNHYRVFAEDGSLSFEKKIAGVKTKTSIMFDPVQHAFWRIRHDASSDELVWETAPNSGGVPGNWTERQRMARQLTITAIRVELKAGTFQSEANAPGTVRFDNLLVTTP